ncbi:MAG: hypothetical protein AUG08_11660 [Acidobacteria bacterium 13_1_20CM_2_55_15]|nr:MAG: hypothetical protein AUG08_11660 [Acidobacteria bacterium 13_1_20CM_2_55_15]
MRTPPPWTCKTGGYGVTTKICIFAKHRAHAGLGTVAAVYFLRLRASLEVSRCRAHAPRALALRGPPAIAN